MEGRESTTAPEPKAQHAPGEPATTAAASAAPRPAIASAVALFFLAPAIAELLSSSSPPKEYFAPGALLFMHLSYGALAVLLREWAVRQRLGPWARLVLALVVGLYIEGIVCKSFFSPEWNDFPFPLGYGRLLGVNWPWAFNLLVYHALNSLLIPWLIVEQLFPAQRAAPALGQRSMAWLGAGVLATGVFGWCLLPMNKAGEIYHPGVLAAVVSWSALVACPLLSLRVRGPRGASGKPPHPYLVGWVVGLGWFGFFFSQYKLDQLGTPASLAMAVSVVYCIMALLIAWAWRGRLQAAQRFAMVAGSVWFWAIFAVIAENDKTRPDDTSGMSVLGILAVLALFVMRHYLLARQRSQMNTELGGRIDSQ